MDEQLIQRLKDNVADLVSRYETMQARNAELTSRLSAYESSIDEKDKTIKELKERLDNLQLTMAFDGSSPADRAESKKKIAHLMKEIDKCISLLND